MPKRTNRKSTRGSRNASKGASGSYQTIRANIGHAFPQHAMVWMRYSDLVSRAPAATTFEERQFNLNSTFDPDRTGTGHQPMGRDQLLGNIYNKYRVHTVRFRIEMINQFTNTGMLAYVGTSNDVTSIVTPNYNCLEQPQTQTKLLTYYAAQAGPVVFEKTVNLWDVWGRTKQEYITDDITGADYTTSPSEVLLLKVGAIAADGTSVIVYQYTIQMDMLVELYDRVVVPNS